MLNPVYVTGHKSPDSDSIVSAIAYANYKRMHGENAIAGRVGPIRSDTEYLLERFGFDDPLHLYTAKCTIKEIDIDEPTLLTPETTVKRAMHIMLRSVVKTAFVVNEEGKLEGALSMSNLNELWTADEFTLSNLLRTSKLGDICHILQAEVLNEADVFLTNGNVVLALGDDVSIEKGDIVITSNVNSYLKAAGKGAGLIIAIGNHDTFKALKADMLSKNITVILTSLTPLKVSKLIYQTMPVKEVMVKNKVVSVSYDETVDETMVKMANSRFRSYPVLDENDKVIGVISRYHLVNYKKKQLILVDHNEKKQSIDDIESGEVIEIVDHHRIGNLSTTNPISMTTMIIGATATIIARKYLDEGLELTKNMAGLLLGGIISDTMNYQSPTCTKIDIETGRQLEEISGVKSDELYKGIIVNGVSLLDRKSIDILYEDYKEFEINGVKLGICQTTCKNDEEFMAVKESLTNTLEDVCATKNFEVIIALLTDPYGAGSYILAGGPRKDLIDIMYPQKDEFNFVNKLVSRKKQLLPGIIEVLS